MSRTARFAEANRYVAHLVHRDTPHPKRRATRAKCSLLEQRRRAVRATDLVPANGRCRRAGLDGVRYDK